MSRHWRFFLGVLAFLVLSAASCGFQGTVHPRSVYELCQRHAQLFCLFRLKFEMGNGFPEVEHHAPVGIHNMETQVLAFE